MPLILVLALFSQFLGWLKSQIGDAPYVVRYTAAFIFLSIVVLDISVLLTFVTLVYRKAVSNTIEASAEVIQRAPG